MDNLIYHKKKMSSLTKKLQKQIYNMWKKFQNPFEMTHSTNLNKKDWVTKIRYFGIFRQKLLQIRKIQSNVLRFRSRSSFVPLINDFSHLKVISLNMIGSRGWMVELDGQLVRRTAPICIVFFFVYLHLIWKSGEIMIKWEHFLSWLRQNRCSLCHRI